MRAAISAVTRGDLRFMQVAFLRQVASCRKSAKRVTSFLLREGLFQSRTSPTSTEVASVTLTMYPTLPLGVASGALRFAMHSRNLPRLIIRKKVQGCVMSTIHKAVDAAVDTRKMVRFFKAL
jgi:hypothetical protein